MTGSLSNQRLLVLMFTDLVGSSALKTRLGDVDYANKVVRPHNRIFRAILASIPGAEENNYTGDGFLAIFPRVSDAVNAALRFHHVLRTYAWEAVPVSTRIGIHVGETVLLEGPEAGKLVIASHAADMCARVMSLGQGGQTLLTRHAFDDARQYVRQHPPLPGCDNEPTIKWVAHGQYRFKGKDDDPLEVFEVGAVDFAPLTAPPDSEKARRVQVAQSTPSADDTAGRQPSEPIDSIAVLPLVNENPDPDTEYLSDGISEGVINLLSQLPSLRVLARSTVFRYKGGQVDAQEVGRTLNVRAVLTGRLLQRGKQVMIKTELVDVRDGTHLWGQRLTWELAEIFAAEEAISRKIAGQLRLRLTIEEGQRLGKRHTESTEAYQFYLKGRYHWNRRTVEDFGKSIKYFEQAVEQDPAYALAYAGLAEAHASLGAWMVKPAKSAFPLARRFAERSRELDAGLAEAHAALAIVNMSFYWNWSEAEAGFLRALELNPGYATAHFRYAYLLMILGRFKEALAGMKRAQELEPLSLIINANVGFILYFMRCHAEAIDQLQATLAMDAQFHVAHYMLGRTYEQQGKYEQAIEAFQKAVLLGQGVPADLYALVHAYAVSGRRNDALKAFTQFLELSEHKYVPPSMIGYSYIHLGEDQKGFAGLEKAYDERDYYLIYLRIDPRLDYLQADPRFISLQHRMQLDP
jgi:TolB-like protein/class 3 adenylate cyclase/Flp pilus assembly protein TadD